MFSDSADSLRNVSAVEDTQTERTIIRVQIKGEDQDVEFFSRFKSRGESQSEAF